eukprot:TRINITY_DN4320_c0_g1_i1.p1 TRINITY_DN4320_c0_g1~~TRINITY_DN4320_c0_g1_i1.p1  ORF type:complete len:394 (+),score=65.95 TRINITY_DN4320_c0_g1_i1:28-1182(+)
MAQCIACGRVKLRDEFPSLRCLTPQCKHPPMWCTSCYAVRFGLWGAADYRDGKPPAPAAAPPGQQLLCPTCQEPLPSESLKVLAEDALDLYSRCFHPQSLAAPAQQEGSQGAAKEVVVTKLTGESVSVSLEGLKTVGDLRAALAKKTGVEPGRQRLMTAGRSAFPLNPSALLSDCHAALAPGASLQLVVLMCSFASSSSQPQQPSKSIRFDLTWGYPEAGRDDLDCTCFAYAANGKYRCCVDFCNREQLDGALKHSGDCEESRDPQSASGRQSVWISLARLPSDVMHLFFALSAARSQSLAAFPWSRVCVRDATSPEQQLAEYAIDRAEKARAIVMCSMHRSAWQADLWDVLALGEPSGGSVRDYSVMKHTCERVITSVTTSPC